MTDDLRAAAAERVTRARARHEHMQSLGTPFAIAAAWNELVIARNDQDGLERLLAPAFGSRL